MLTRFGERDYELLKEAAAELWRSDAEFLDEKVFDYPFDAFEIYLRLYGEFKVLLEYENGTFALKLWTEGQYKYLDKLTSEQSYYGFKSMKPQNVRHNYLVLDRLLRGRMAGPASGSRG